MMPRLALGPWFSCWLPVLLASLTSVWGGGAGSPPTDTDYFNDWVLLGGRPSQPTCVDIPRNMTLCHDIGYSKMRLPNLLEHDTMGEVSQQAASWVPLLNIECHPDTQLFLCSLFSPVCLDRPIYPCRSLCDKVRVGCEGRMRVYGFPWPDILRCDKFPLDNDMCITAQSSNNAADSSACQACRQADTYENILDNFCRADFALKTRVKKVKKSKVICRKSKVYKASSTDKKELRSIRRPTFRLENLHECCGRFGQDSKMNYLIMGMRKGGDLVPTFIMEWRANSKAFRNAIRVFKSLDCSDPKMLSESMLADGSGSTSSTRAKSHRNLAEAPPLLSDLKPTRKDTPTLPDLKGRQRQRHHRKRTTNHPKITLTTDV